MSLYVAQHITAHREREREREMCHRDLEYSVYRIITTSAILLISLSFFYRSFIWWDLSLNIVQSACIVTVA